MHWKQFLQKQHIHSVHTRFPLDVGGWVGCMIFGKLRNSGGRGGGRGLENNKILGGEWVTGCWGGGNVFRGVAFP